MNDDDEVRREIEEELRLVNGGLANVVYLESDEYPAYEFTASQGPSDAAVELVSETKKHRWTGVNSCQDRTRDEVASAFHAWNAAVVAARPNQKLIRAGHDRPALSFKQSGGGIGGKRKCSGTAYIPCWAEFTVPK